MNRSLLSAALLVLLASSGCGSGDSESSAGDPHEAPAPTAEPTTPRASPTAAQPDGRTSSPRPKGTTIITADSEYGSMLYDAGGQPIYLFTAEPDQRPACYDECAENWPPVLTDGGPRAADGVDDGLLGTTRRSDGGTQVTYAGHPLYFYAHEGRYEVLCHDVDEYGGTWLVVQPDGRAAPA